MAIPTASVVSSLPKSEAGKVMETSSSSARAVIVAVISAFTITEWRQAIDYQGGVTHMTI